MNAQELITEHLDIWTMAQEPPKTGGRGRGKKKNDQSLYGIKKLRELILDLAVRGKLVEQNPADLPASVLLVKIAAEKARLVKEKKIKKQKKLPEIAEEEKPFDLPEGWEWVRLGNIIEFVNGYAFKSKDFVDDGIGIVKIGDIQNGEITTASMARVEKHIVNDLDLSLAVNKGDMLIAMSGATTGKLGFNTCNETFYLNQRVGKITPYFLSKNFLYYPLTTKIAENLAKSMGSAIPNLSTVQIKNIILALPPLPEQHRIVAKVDELIALCDQLEQQQTTSNATYQTLLQTLLAALTKSANHQAFTTAWERIATHFDLLFTTEQSIDQLKQTILQLAVMGKLVPPACRQAGRTPTTLPVSQKGAWWVYVIECEDGSFYKGFTENLPRRWKQHLAGTASSWTRKHPPKQVFYWEKWCSRQAALNREHYLKSGSGREWFQREVVENKEAWQPASVLLEKIAKEKARLIKEGKIKKQKKMPEITEEEKPFALPDGWVWSRLQDVTKLITDGKHGDCNNLPNSGYYFLSAKDIQNGELLYENARQIEQVEFEEVHQRTDLQAGDICMVNTGATVGKMAIATDHEFTTRTTFQKSVAVIKPVYPYIEQRYIANFLTAETPRLLKKSGGSAINNLLLGDLKKKLVPVPPTTEQHRIVAKVDELMALCDQLKTRLYENQTTKLQLADTIVRQAVV